MEATICFLGVASNNDRCYRVVQTLGYCFRNPCIHLYVPLSIFNFCKFLHGAPKECKKIAAQTCLYEQLCGHSFRDGAGTSCLRKRTSTVITHFELEVSLRL